METYCRGEVRSSALTFDVSELDEQPRRQKLEKLNCYINGSMCELPSREDEDQLSLAQEE